jgi:hypothetical protein
MHMPTIGESNRVAPDTLVSCCTSDGSSSLFEHSFLTRQPTTIEVRNSYHYHRNSIVLVMEHRIFFTNIHFDTTIV